MRRQVSQPSPGSAPMTTSKLSPSVREERMVYNWPLSTVNVSASTAIWASASSTPYVVDCSLTHVITSCASGYTLAT